ncbi:alpha-ribazole phosphatase [Acetivibrio straminisolvens]|jgi:alpha-ribazole phosphatase|uniref:Alpha-ribazole phosphatase n=1 Tax=Acetivibrio straminisolvens JCM 21531 TaxID=1294263 RepID=W4V4F0_9FIRM|nr:alpha-ribazole phosphatase [Acetivibrio straminisolvens]GAE88012.1 alpha-ribazole-5'-phosphate phosphatase [Acetivibrio straminisolvens JCM 21531]
MLELYLVRHGETDSNKRGTYLGWTDVELNSNGICQAKAIRDKLKTVKVDAIYSSPFNRTVKTAEIINENYGLEIITSDNLKERNFGIWDDLTFEEISSRYPDDCKRWFEDWINFRIKDGESAKDTYDRVVAFVREIINSKKEGGCLIVSHLGTIRFMLAYLLGMKIEDSWRFRVDNCTITKLEVRDRYPVLTLLNG